MIDSCARLRFEQLEEKKLLAGDVAVSVVAGALIVEGDDMGNQVAISSGEAPGEFIVAGLDGTTVHMEGEDATDQDVEETGEVVVVSGVRRGVHVVTYEGDDTVIIEDARIRGNVTIRTGAGNDTVQIGPSSSIETDLTDEEELANANVAIGRSLVIRTGTENDTVTLGGAALGQDERDEEGEGETSAALVVRGHTTVGLGEGEDTLAVDSVLGRWGLTANGSLGEDDIDVSNSRFRFLGISAGAGESSDSVEIENVNARAAMIATGDGGDDVEIADSAFGFLGAHLGAGDDTLSISGSSARLAILLGGPGDGDAWNDDGGNDFGRQIVRGFELPAPVTVDEDQEE